MRACTATVGDGGATLVQGGSFRGDRATFSQIEAMRDALPAEVLLKWTQPLRSVEMMLVCMALGVNRFNGDIPTLLKSAERSTLGWSGGVGCYPGRVVCGLDVSGAGPDPGTWIGVGVECQRL